MRSAITTDCNKGWAIKFQHEAEMAAKRILEHPLAWQFERDPFRRFLLNRFPYKMLYVIENNRILVIAVSHQHRQPDYRIERNNRA
ncbi:MAG TPA: type II toxin-antitoxin system RelE/ParE family toxin [Gallionellaceae bacterium]|nr:type II toxin-antitoxin system RelE/ParE family toxin [Gallionellaceae bacterium]